MKTLRSTTECSFVKIFVLRLTTDDIGSKQTNHIFDAPARFARRIFLLHQRFLLFEIVHFFFQVSGTARKLFYVCQVYIQDQSCNNFVNDKV